MYIEFVSDVTVRVPLREKSKDWKYASGAEGLDVNANGYITRPYGWVDLKAGVGSSVKIIVPTMLSSTGYTTTLDVNLVDVNVQTSVNYASLLTELGTLTSRYHSLSYTFCVIIYFYSRTL
jgi:hypothetical protein